MLHIAQSLEPYARLIELFISALTLLAVVVGAALLRRQILKDHEWNRRKTSQDVLMSLVTGEFTKIREELEVRCGVKLDDSQQTYATLAPTVQGNLRQLNFALERLLNFYETIAIGLKNNVLDEEVCYDHFSWNLTRYWEWTEPYHKKVRGLDPTIWIEAGYYAKRWADRIERELAQLRKDGKPPL